MEREVLLQLGLLLLTIGMFFVIFHLPRQALSKIRSRGRAAVQANRYFLEGVQLLSRARSARSRSASLSMAKDAAAQADRALSLDPRDAAAHILKALALDLLGRHSCALRSLDAALSPPAVRSLSNSERGDALLKRAEIQMGAAATGRSRRKMRAAAAAEADLADAVKLCPDNSKAWAAMGLFYEEKGLKVEACKAFKQAQTADPGFVVAHKGLRRLGAE